MRTAVIVSAYNEADRIAGTVAVLREALPDARVLVADDGSTDGTAAAAAAAGAEVVSAPRNIGKGGANTLAAQRLLSMAWEEDDPPVFLLCDGDLAETARHLPVLVETVRTGQADLAVARFARRVGGGIGAAKGFARWAIRRRCRFLATEPISGQRALSARALRVAVPFAHGFGMEIGITVDVVRAGYAVREVELPLEHRATGKTLGGFVHRFRQLLDFLRVYVARR